VDEHELRKLARQVRAAQKQYFRLRDNLEECKALERRLDGELAGGTQPTLFDQLAGPAPSPVSGALDQAERLLDSWAVEGFPLSVAMQASLRRLVRRVVLDAARVCRARSQAAAALSARIEAGKCADAVAHCLLCAPGESVCLACDGAGCPGCKGAGVVRQEGLTP